MGANRFYEEGEAQEILHRALRASDSAAIERAQLVSMAAELGISEEALSQAEAQLAREKAAEASKLEDEKRRAEFRAHRRRSFWADLGTYFAVNGFFVGVWWIIGGEFWPFWLMAVWGIGVVSDFIGAFVAFSEKDYERWRRRQVRRAAKSRTNRSGVKALLDEVSPDLRDQRAEKIKVLVEHFGMDVPEAEQTVDEYDSRSRLFR